VFSKHKIIIKKCMCVRREANGRPIFDVQVKTTGTSNVLKIPPNYRGVLFRMGPEKNRFIYYAHRLLSEATFEPEIIDRYPRADRPELQFPSAIKMVRLSIY
jgi:hypothetical protein